jgi:hypothetical protein
MEIIKKYKLIVEVYEQLKDGQVRVKIAGKEYVASKLWLDDFYETDLSTLFEIKKVKPKIKHNLNL